MDLSNQSAKYQKQYAAVNQFLFYPFYFCSEANLVLHSVVISYFERVLPNHFISNLMLDLIFLFRCSHSSVISLALCRLFGQHSPNMKLLDYSIFIPSIYLLAQKIQSRERDVERSDQQQQNSL